MEGGSSGNGVTVSFWEDNGTDDQERGMVRGLEGGVGDVKFELTRSRRLREWRGRSGPGVGKARKESKEGCQDWEAILRSRRDRTRVSVQYKTTLGSLRNPKKRSKSE